MKSKINSVINDRTGITLVAVTLIVMAAVGFFAHQHRVGLHQEAVRTAGQSLVRAIAAIDTAKLTSPTVGDGLLQRVVAPSGDQNFAYVAVTKPDGNILYSIGPISPDARSFPNEPHAWFGESQFIAKVSQQEITEIHAPLMESGALAGFVRLGYLSLPLHGWGADMPFIAALLMPICVLMLVAYMAVRHEIKSLSNFSQKLTTLAESLVPDNKLLSKGRSIVDFRNHIQQFIDLVQTWTEQTKKEILTAQTATHLVVYRQEKAESVLHAVPDAMVILDEDGLPTFANSRATTLLDRKLESVIGKPLRDWCSNGEVQAFLLKFRNASTAPGLSTMTYAPTSQSEKRISVSVHSILSLRDKNSLLGRLVLFRDITSEYLARQSGAEFVSHAAHELKTPLATLSAYSENLMDYAVMSEEDRVHSVNVINEEARRMAGLINNLLSISKLDAGTLQLSRSRVKIHELLQNSFDAILPMATQNNISMRLKMPQDLGSARLDKDLLRIAIDNVLGNAVKYSNSGGEVILAAEISENDELQVTVQDCGIGMSQQDCARVFDKHYRSSSSEATSRSGHGLGLFLARQIIELHKGRILVESELGKGSIFTINLNAQAMNLEGSSD